MYHWNENVWKNRKSYDNIIHSTNQDKKIGLGTRPVWWRDSGSIIHFLYVPHYTILSPSSMPLCWPSCNVCPPHHVICPSCSVRAVVSIVHRGRSNQGKTKALGDLYTHSPMMPPMCWRACRSSKCACQDGCTTTR